MLVRLFPKMQFKLRTYVQTYVRAYLFRNKDVSENEFVKKNLNLLYEFLGTIK